jgi:AcrR family transcriptional regulator
MTPKESANAETTRTERLGRDAYYDAAFDLLAEQGPSGLTIAALCTRLGVTKGSFYHHFDDMPAFVRLLLEHWRTEHATRLITLSESIADPGERFDLLEGIAIGLPHGTEAAIRAWSWSDETVAQAQHAVDMDRLDHLTRSGMAAGHSAERAELLARISLSVLVGLQQLERPASVATFEHVFGEIRQWVN